MKLPFLLSVQEEPLYVLIVCINSTTFCSIVVVSVFILKEILKYAD
jgi:hypothetical protein